MHAFASCFFWKDLVLLDEFDYCQISCAESDCANIWFMRGFAP